MIRYQDLIKDYFTVCGIITNIAIFLFLISKFYSSRSYKTQNRITGFFLMFDLYRAIKAGLAFREKETIIIYKNDFTENKFFHGIKINFLIALDMFLNGKFMREYFIREHCFDDDYIIMRFNKYIIHRNIKRPKKYQ